MEIEITTEVTKKYDIPNEQAAKIALEYIKKEFDIEPHMWIENGNLMEEVEYITSHKWTDNEAIRVATKKDKYLLKTVKLINDRIHNEGLSY
jgi:hypothetical protein